MEAGSSRPVTMYLADHHPHAVAPSPTTPIARPHFVNGLSYHEGRSDGAGFEDVEMRGGFGGVGDGERGGGGSGRDVGAGKGAEEVDVGPKNRNCLIGWSFLAALIVIGAVFALLFVKARKDGVADR